MGCDLDLSGSHDIICHVTVRVLWCEQQVIARIIDGSRFDEFKALYGETLVTGKVKQRHFSLFQTVKYDCVAAVE